MTTPNPIPRKHELDPAVRRAAALKAYSTAEAHLREIVTVIEGPECKCADITRRRMIKDAESALSCLRESLGMLL